MLQISSFFPIKANFPSRAPADLSPNILPTPKHSINSTSNRITVPPQPSPHSTMSFSSSPIKMFALCMLLAALFSPALCAPFPLSVRQATEPSASPEESPEPEEEECVDARYLTSYSAEHLVHPAHMMADVLCPADSTLPCGTANHMVRIAGKPISYAALCETRKCTADRMLVNSVLSHEWKEQKHGEGLVLTMFDVRHPEVAQKTLHRFIAMRRTMERAIFKSTKSVIATRMAFTWLVSYSG